MDEKNDAGKFRLQSLRKKLIAIKLHGHATGENWLWTWLFFASLALSLFPPPPPSSLPFPPPPFLFYGRFRFLSSAPERLDSEPACAKPA